MKQARERAYKDKRIYTTYGVHPKQAHVVTKDDMERVKIAILRDPLEALDAANKLR